MMQILELTKFSFAKFLCRFKKGALTILENLFKFSLAKFVCPFEKGALSF